MEIKNYFHQFQEAILSKEFEKAEAILISTDCKKNIIQEYIQINSVDMLTMSLPSLKSKGLVKMIEDCIG